MPKKVKVAESCVFITTDGKREVVPSAKEALTTLSKNKIDVIIFLTDTSKDDAAKFLKENDIPYKALVNDEDKPEDGKKPTYDACVLPNKGIVVLRYGWDSALSSLVDIIYGDDKPMLTPQQKMDDKFKDYKSWAVKANSSKTGVASS